MVHVFTTIFNVLGKKKEREDPCVTNSNACKPVTGLKYSDPINPGSFNLNPT